MKKMLLVLGVMLFASSAFGAVTTYNFTFDGFCDGMTLNLGNTNTNLPLPNPKLFVAGTHNNYDCAGSVAVVSGFKHGNNKLQIPPFVSPVLDVGSPILGPSLSLEYLVQPTPSCVWANYYSADGFNNNNFLSGTCTLSGPLGVGAKSSAPAR